MFGDCMARPRRAPAHEGYVDANRLVGGRRVDLRKGVATVFRVSFQTGKIEPVAQFPVETVGSSCDLFPDRSAVICSLLEQKSDAWIVENFDPEIR